MFGRTGALCCWPGPVQEGVEGRYGDTAPVLSSCCFASRTHWVKSIPQIILSIYWICSLHHLTHQNISPWEQQEFFLSSERCIKSLLYWGSFAITESNVEWCNCLAFTVLMKFWWYTLGQNLVGNLFKFLSGKSCSASLWGSCNSTAPCGRVISWAHLPLWSWNLLWFCFVFSKTTGEQLPAAPVFHPSDITPLNVPVGGWHLPMTEMWHHWPLPLVLRLPSPMDLSGCTGASLGWFPLLLHKMGITLRSSAESQEMHCWKKLCPGLRPSWSRRPNCCNSATGML